MLFCELLIVVLFCMLVEVVKSNIQYKQDKKQFETEIPGIQYISYYTWL